jgi:hypothetical protein
MASHYVVLCVLWISIIISNIGDGHMKQNKNYFSNGNKQMLKEGLAVLGLMLFLALVAVLLGWYKGMLIWPF